MTGAPRPDAEDPRVEAVDDPSPADMAAVDGGLHAFNVRTADLAAIRKIGCFARLSSGEVVGGAVGRSWGAACEMLQIWVREDHRRLGLGRRLVRAFEAHARRRGCTLLYLDTFSWQAPDFYRGLGFEVGCELDGFPQGARKFILRKSLAPRNG